MPRDVFNDNQIKDRFTPVLDGDKLNVEETAKKAAKLLLDDSTLGPSGHTSKKIYQQKLMDTVKAIDSQLKPYTNDDSLLFHNFEDRLKHNLEVDLHEHKLLYTFLKAETPNNQRFHNKLSYRQLENKIDSSEHNHLAVEHSLLTLIKDERNRSSELHKIMSKLNPLTWLDNQCESLMYTWFIIEGIQ